jgi:two-component system, sensor histidine kinase PdtaS
MTKASRGHEDLLRENETLRRELQEARETLDAIRRGEVDALVVSGPNGNQIFTLQGADRPFRTFVEEMQQGAMVLSASGEILYCNRRFGEITGRGDVATLGSLFCELLAGPESKPVLMALLERAVAGRATAELDLLAADGTTVPALLAVCPLSTEETLAFSVVVTDLTEQRHFKLVEAAEARLRVALREKEILLKEIHHRVKNNLQIIASMLALQASAVKDEAGRAPLRESQNRVRTIALIHEKLYGSSDLASVPFCDYVNELAGYLYDAYSESAPRVALEIDAEDIVLEVGTAIPLALVLNELLTNAFKHGFPDGRQGVVHVGFHRLGGDQVHLRVSNDGVRFPEAIDPNATESLGLQLVVVLAKQLGATLELLRSPTTTFALTIPSC